jgi:hypothetical protein
VYIDDVFFVGDNIPYEHYVSLYKILNILRAQKLFLNRKKSKLFIIMTNLLDYLDLKSNRVDILQIKQKLQPSAPSHHPYLFRSLDEISAPSPGLPAIYLSPIQYRHPCISFSMLTDGSGQPHTTMPSKG